MFGSQYLEQAAIVALVLTESDVLGVVSMKDGLRLAEESFRQHALGQATLAPRMVMRLAGQAGMLRIMAAVVPAMGGVGVKTLAGIPGKRARDRTYFVMLHLDPDSGGLLAVLPAAHITGIRTGAASGVATKYLARKNSHTLGLFGAGFQARYQVAAIRSVRPIVRVKVHDVVPEAAHALAAELATEGLEVSIAASAEEAARGCDVLASATTATEPFIRAKWLEPGQHINAAGANVPSKGEVDAETFAKARVVVDFRTQALEEAGDLMKALESGAITDRGIHAEIGDVVLGRATGRENEEQITLFKSVGVAIEDVTLAAFAYERAIAEGLGREIDLQS